MIPGGVVAALDVHGADLTSLLLGTVAEGHRRSLGTIERVTTLNYVSLLKLKPRTIAQGTSVNEQLQHIVGYALTSTAVLLLLLVHTAMHDWH